MLSELPKARGVAGDRGAAEPKAELARISAEPLLAAPGPAEKAAIQDRPAPAGTKDAFTPRVGAANARQSPGACPARLSRGPTSRPEGTVAGARRDGTPCPVPKSQLCVPRRLPAAANPSPSRNADRRNAPLRSTVFTQRISVMTRHTHCSGTVLYPLGHTAPKFPRQLMETHVSTATARGSRKPRRRRRPALGTRGPFQPTAAVPGPHPASRLAPNPQSFPGSRRAALHRREGRAPGPSRDHTRPPPPSRTPQCRSDREPTPSAGAARAPRPAGDSAQPLGGPCGGRSQD